MLRLAVVVFDSIPVDAPMLRPLLQAQRLVLPGRLAWQRGLWREARDAYDNALAHETALRIFGEDVCLLQTAS